MVRQCACSFGRVPFDLDAQVLDLDPEDVKHITALDRNKRLCNYANEHGKVNGWTYEQLGW